MKTETVVVKGQDWNISTSSWMDRWWNKSSDGILLDNSRNGDIVNIDLLPVRHAERPRAGLLFSWGAGATNG